MKWINKLERKFGRYAIQNLMTYIIGLYCLGFVINMVNPMIYYRYLSLDASQILRGQIWRLVTFIIQPPSNNILFVILSLYLYYMIGTNLERTWGAFRFNLYFFAGMLGHIIAALLVYLISGRVYRLTTTYLNFSLFFAFGMTYPDMQFLVYFIIPVKVKYLAYIDGAFFLIQAVFSVIYGDYATVVAIVVSMLNMVWFFFATRNLRRLDPREIHRRHTYKQQVRQPKGITKHKCAICGRTELDGEDIEFRFCSKCNGNYEYCQEHLFTHTHVK